MNNKDFWNHVYAGASPEISQESLKAAVDFYIEWNLRDRKSDYQSRRECINLAMRFDIQRVRDSSSQSGESPFQHLPITPDDLVVSDDFAKKIRPVVEQLRTTLFGSPNPPFSAYEEAAQWLEQTAAEQDASAQAKRQVRVALEQTIFEKLQEYQAMTGENWQCPFLHNFLEYAKPGSDWVHRVHIWGGTSLTTLVNESKNLADATGFTQASVVAYILADIRPLLVPVSVSVLSSCNNQWGISSRRATVELRRSHITENQLKEIHKVIRRAWGTAKKKRLKEADKQFLAIVKRLGGEPKAKGHGEITIFSEKVREKYNTLAVKHGWTPLRGWRYTWLKYRRLRERIQ